MLAVAPLFFSGATAAYATTGDKDGDGESDEDQGDLFGSIESFEASTGVLVVTSVAGITVTSVVDEETEIEREKPEGHQGDFDDEGSVADLVAGAAVAEIELDDETGAFEKDKVYAQG